MTEQWEKDVQELTEDLQNLREDLQDMHLLVTSQGQILQALSQRASLLENAAIATNTKLDTLIQTGIKTQAVFETALTMVKASPVIVTILAALCGGIMWLIKHA